jgi:hypothetical protein
VDAALNPPGQDGFELWGVEATEGAGVLPRRNPRAWAREAWCGRPNRAMPERLVRPAKLATTASEKVGTRSQLDLHRERGSKTVWSTSTSDFGMAGIPGWCSTRDSGPLHHRIPVHW